VPLAPERAGDAAVIGISLDITEGTQRERELRAQLEVIERQQQALRAMSTPIIEVWDRVLCLPILGLVDSVRTADIMESLLQAVVRVRARFAILDMTGVEVVDTSTAGHLLGLVRAIELLGARGIITGIHPNIAQTIVTLDVDLSRIAVFANLREALKHCLADGVGGAADLVVADRLDAHRALVAGLVAEAGDRDLPGPRLGGLVELAVLRVPEAGAHDLLDRAGEVDLRLARGGAADLAVVLLELEDLVVLDLHRGAQQGLVEGRVELQLPEHFGGAVDLVDELDLFHGRGGRVSGFRGRRDRVTGRGGGRPRGR
jgi:anti-anti-sigma regulatory factor